MKSGFNLSYAPLHFRKGSEMRVWKWRSVPFDILVRLKAVRWRSRNIIIASIIAQIFLIAPRRAMLDRSGREG